MIGRALSMRLFAVLFALACAVFVLIAGYRALLVYAGPLVAPAAMAGICAFMALSLVGFMQLRASRRKARLQAVVANLIDHKPIAALAGALVAGAAARFGIEPEDLFPIFEAFTPNRLDSENSGPETPDPLATTPPPPAPQAHPSSPPQSPPQQSVH